MLDNIKIDIERVDKAIYSNIFSFAKHTFPHQITPLSKACPLKTTIMFESEIAPEIEELACFRDAVYAALYLKGLGHSVSVVEGMYKVDLCTIKSDLRKSVSAKGWMTHRWIVVDGKHVDITIEYGSSHLKTRNFIYKPMRVYAPEDLFAFALKTGKDYRQDSMPIWCSSLDGINYCIGGMPVKWSLIKSSGEYFCFKNHKSNVA